MDYTQKISEIIDETLEKKTFSLEIIEKIKSLKDGFEDGKREIDNLASALTRTQSENNRITSLNRDLIEKNDQYKEVQDKVEAERKTQDKLTYELNYQRSRGDEMRAIVREVFQNPVVFKTARECTPPHYDKSGGNSVWVDSQEKDITSKEQINNQP